MPESFGLCRPYDIFPRFVGRSVDPGSLCGLCELGGEMFEIRTMKPPTIPLDRILALEPVCLRMTVPESYRDRNGHMNMRRNRFALIAVPRGGTLLIMKTHEQIDQRSLALAQAVADAIDRDPSRAGLERARKTCERWRLQSPSLAVAEWSRILELGWDEIRTLLLDPGEQGQRLRQSNPFCGVLSPGERWEIYRRFAHEPQAA